MNNPRKSRVLHLQTLIDKGACAVQVKLFRKTWGDSVHVTVDRMTAVAPLFNWGWGAQHLLSRPAWADYQRATAAARADYERAMAAAWATAYISDTGAA